MQNLYLQKYLVFISVSIVPTTSELRVSRPIIWNYFFQVQLLIFKSLQQFLKEKHSCLSSFLSILSPTPHSPG